MKLVACAASIALSVVFSVSAGTAESVGMHGLTVACLAVSAAFLAGAIALMWGRRLR